MKRFTRLYDELDATTRTSEKEAALEAYFREAPPADAAWALALLTGRRPRRGVSPRQLRDWAAEHTGLPAWLIDECYDAVGDLSETIALLLPRCDEAGTGRAVEYPLHRVINEFVAPLASMAEPQKRGLIVRLWQELEPRQRYILHKLISGSFRVGAARRLVVRALARVAEIEPALMEHRLLGSWLPTAQDLAALMSPAGAADDPARPYPFFLASQLDDPPETLGERAEWLAEWKWDGIRAQLIHRGAAPGPSTAVLWTRGEEIASGAFPELVAAAREFPVGTVLDGEVLAWERGAPLGFAALQRRLNRVGVIPSLFPDVPVIFMAYDLLELEGTDQRAVPFEERRARLEALVERVPEPHVLVSPLVEGATWDELGKHRAGSRDKMVEGLMLKRIGSRYGVGRTRGDWWKWKIEPLTIDAVLTGAQRGTGKRASLLTDYTFSVWRAGELVPIAKAYSGLTDEEILAVDALLRGATIERRGPVRIVRPELVFELAFEGVQESGRHRSGVALRFPRISRWRRDKRAADADSLDVLLAMLRAAKR
ncbi:MAG: ATP-dependent DNA ligase [Planctomycetota bacterium]|nr:ATP-dependent DNA ligase [Planctomycetota bacterium]